LGSKGEKLTLTRWFPVWSAPLGPYKLRLVS
jgi:hypothetical protein